MGAGSIPFVIYSPLVKILKLLHYNCSHEYSWVVIRRNTSEAVLRPSYFILATILGDNSLAVKSSMQLSDKEGVRIAGPLTVRGGGVMSHVDFKK